MSWFPKPEKRGLHAGGPTAPYTPPQVSFTDELDRCTTDAGRLAQHVSGRTGRNSPAADRLSRQQGRAWNVGSGLPSEPRGRPPLPFLPSMERRTPGQGDFLDTAAAAIVALIRAWSPVLPSDWTVTTPPAGASQGRPYPAGILAREVATRLDLDFSTCLERAKAKNWHHPAESLRQEPYTVTDRTAAVALLVDDFISSGRTMTLARASARQPVGFRLFPSHGPQTRNQEHGRNAIFRHPRIPRLSSGQRRQRMELPLAARQRLHPRPRGIHPVAQVAAQRNGEGIPPGPVVVGKFRASETSRFIDW